MKECQAVCQYSKHRSYNKSLQLSTNRPFESVHAVLNSMRCCVDAAGQLSSMLCGFGDLLSRLAGGRGPPCEGIACAGFAV